MKNKKKNKPTCLHLQFVIEESGETAVSRIESVHSTEENVIRKVAFGGLKVRSISGDL